MGCGHFVLGPSSNYMAYVDAYPGMSMEIPTLQIVGFEKTFGADCTILHKSIATLPTRGLPLLHNTTALDFDDGVGLLVIGTSTGELCFRRYLSSNAITPGSIVDDLPDISVVAGHQLSFVIFHLN